jgi:hypothetical protein
MNDKRARAVTVSALNEIRTKLESADTCEEFLFAVDELLRDPANLLELRDDHGEADPLTIDSKTAMDVHNGPLVYEFLGAQDPSNASDPRLWAYLAFSTYRDYMESRWPLESVRNWKGRVNSRWLVKSAGRAGLIRHGIARLWWITSLTHDPKMQFPLSVGAEDSFAYTRAVFRNEDRIQGLFEREAGSIRPLVRAVLEYADRGQTDVTDFHIRELMKEITLVYGYRDIEVLDDTQLRELVDSLTVEPS